VYHKYDFSHHNLLLGLQVKCQVVPNQHLCVSWYRALSRHWQYSRTALIQIRWDGQASGYAENPDNWIFLGK